MRSSVSLDSMVSGFFLHLKKVGRAVSPSRVICSSTESLQSIAMRRNARSAAPTMPRRKRKPHGLRPTTPSKCPERQIPGYPNAVTDQNGKRHYPRSREAGFQAGTCGPATTCRSIRCPPRGREETVPPGRRGAPPQQRLYRVRRTGSAAPPDHPPG